MLNVTGLINALDAYTSKDGDSPPYNKCETLKIGDS